MSIETPLITAKLTWKMSRFITQHFSWSQKFLSSDRWTDTKGQIMLCVHVRLFAGHMCIETNIFSCSVHKYWQCVYAINTALNVSFYLCTLQTFTGTSQYKIWTTFSTCSSKNAIKWFKMWKKKWLAASLPYRRSATHLSMARMILMTTDFFIECLA